MKTSKRIYLVGVVENDPRITYRPDQAVLDVRFSLATTECWTDRSGQQQERAESHRIVFCDHLAEQLATLLRAGCFIEVEGSMHRSLLDKDADRHTAWEVRGSDYRLLGGNRRGAIQTDFLILPGEVRQVVLPAFDADWVFTGFITSHQSFAIIAARSSNGDPLAIHMVPEDFDPIEAQWAGVMKIMRPGEHAVLFVKNVSDQPARYRAWRR